MRVRFHLANGEHFMHWQVRDGRSVRYYKPEAFSLQMNGCSLVNKAGAAGRIHGLWKYKFGHARNQDI